MFEALHPRSDIDHFYILHRDGGRSFLSLADVTDREKPIVYLHVCTAKPDLNSE